MRSPSDLNRVINEIATSANTDIAPIIQPTKPEGGYFGVPRAVFCYINFLGLLYEGWSGKKKKKKNKKESEKTDFGTTTQAKKYIREVLGEIDELYKINCDVLYDLYRHGTVHIFAPKKMISGVDNKKSIEWLLYKGDRESWQYYESRAKKFRHLRIVEWNNNRYILPLSISVLYADLIESLVLYRQKVLTDETQDLLKKFSSVVDALDTDFDEVSYDFWSDATKPE